MSHTVDTTTTDYVWDIARSLPVVLQDRTNTYVFEAGLAAGRPGGSIAAATCTYVTSPPLLSW